MIHAIIEIPDGDEDNGVNNFTKVKKGLSRELVQVYLSEALVSYDLQRFEEAKALLRKTITVARRVLGESGAYTLRLRWLYANCLCDCNNATLNDVAEAVQTLESVAQLWKRVMGERHPEMARVLNASKAAREQLRLRRAASD